MIYDLRMIVRFWMRRMLQSVRCVGKLVAFALFLFLLMAEKSHFTSFHFRTERTSNPSRMTSKKTAFGDVANGKFCFCSMTIFSANDLFPSYSSHIGQLLCEWTWQQKLPLLWHFLVLSGDQICSISSLLLALWLFKWWQRTEMSAMWSYDLLDTREAQ